jgi:anthranilate 1,2-dioxygenase small subunit
VIAPANGIDSDRLLQWISVNHLYSEYGRLLDEKRLGEWVDLFTEDCLYQAIPRENVEADLPLALIRCEGRRGLLDRVNAIENLLVYKPRVMRHIFSGLRIISTREDVVSTETSFAVFETLEGQHTALFATGCLHGELAWRSGFPQFIQLRAIYDSSLVVNSMVYPL